MNLAFALAAAMSGLTFAIHAFVGGPEIARPLLDSELADVPRLTSYYCWHIVTMVLLAMTGGFAYASLWPSGVELAVLFTGLALGFAAWSGALVLTRRRPPLELPQWALFAPITAAGLVGLLA